MVDWDKEWRQANALEYYLGYLVHMGENDGIEISIIRGEKPETTNPLMKNALERNFAVTGRWGDPNQARFDLEHNLTLLENVYRHTKNPLFAMHGLKICLDADLNLPPWIKTYVQNSTSRLMRFANMNPPITGPTDGLFTECFAFIKKGNETWFMHFQKVINQLRDVLTLMRHRHKTGETWSDAHTYLAAENMFISSAGPDDPPALRTLDELRRAILPIL